MAQGHAGLNAAPIHRSALAAAPKALLHDHLDGGVRPATVIELADGCGWQLPTTDVEELQAWFTRGADSRDLLQYLATFEHTIAVLQTAQALERVAAEAVADLAADGVVYAEIRFAPELHVALDPQEAVEAVTAGFRRGESEASGRITANLICCAMRTADRPARGNLPAVPLTPVGPDRFGPGRSAGGRSGRA